MTRSVILRSAIRSLLAVVVFAAASGAAMAAPNCTVEIEGNEAMPVSYTPSTMHKQPNV